MDIQAFPYHDQSSFPVAYIAVALDRPLNGCSYAVFQEHNGSRLLYSSQDTSSRAMEIARRKAADLPVQRVIFCGKNHSGIAKTTAQIWINKNQMRYADFALSVVIYERAFAVRATPLDWPSDI